MLKFQKRTNISFNELQLVALIEKGLSDSSLRGFLYKRSSPSAKWRLKWFLLFENLLFYFDLPHQSSSSHHQQQHHHHQSPSQYSSTAGLSSLIKRGSGGGSHTARPTAAAAGRNQSANNAAPTIEQNGRAAHLLRADQEHQEPPRRASAGAETLPVQEQEREQARPVTGGSADTMATVKLSSGRQRLSSDGLLLTSTNYAAAAAANNDLFKAPHSRQPTPMPMSSSSLLTTNPTPANNRGGSSSSSCGGGGGGSKLRLDSSSISGVSSHFLAHNEQVIGRSSTTTAGKTATSSANYASLLSRKIGVIFLEGSYCERLVDSASAPVARSMADFCTDSSGALQHQQNFIHQSRPDSAAEASACDQTIPSGAGCGEESELNCIFTLTWRKTGSKEYQFRCETEAECQIWAHAISNARYSSLLNDKEQLEQKYLHLSQIIESESTAKWQYSRQCEEFLAEIAKLREEVCLLKRQETRSNHLRLVLTKSAAIVDAIMRQQRRRQRQQQQQARPPGGGPVVLDKTSLRQLNEEDSDDCDTTTGSNNSQPPAAGEKTQQQAARRSSIAYSPLVSPAPAQVRGPQLRDSNRTRSMDQEQEEQDLAIRRVVRRCNSNFRPSSACASDRQLACFSAPTDGRIISTSRKQQLRSSQEHLAAHSQRRSSSACPATTTTAANAKTEASSSSPPPKGKRAAAAGSRSLSANITTTAAAAADKLARLPGRQSKSPAAVEVAQQSQAAAEDEQNDNEEAAAAAAAAAATDEEDEDDEAYDEALSVELKSVVEALNDGLIISAGDLSLLEAAESSEEIRKIKKVQGFFRGWLCRRRWKQIVQEYIKSPHAESMRKRNNLVFRMVECEEEYVEQLTMLIAAFLRPIKMAASSQRPALNHDELNSIFLNSETLLFLHQIFLKGLTARMESWPTLVLADLFNMLLPMLTIYQEYVRNHHFSLQILAECKQREQFSLLLRRLEEKPVLNGRTLETFLTYPMHQIPRYIICLHEILAHTPHNHVERKSLYAAQTKLEELSMQMHDEVSETENIRQNLAIERMIIGGCDILLDVNQVFVRQGILLQVVEQPSKGHKSHKSRLSSFTGRAAKDQNNQLDSLLFQQQLDSSSNNNNNNSSQQANISGFYCDTPFASSSPSSSSQANNATPAGSMRRNELIRQCFLFTNHLLLCTRTKDGKLHLLENIGRISLSEVTLIENPLEFIQQQESNFEFVPSSAEDLVAGNWRPPSRATNGFSASWTSAQQQQPDGATRRSSPSHNQNQGNLGGDAQNHTGGGVVGFRDQEQEPRTPIKTQPPPPPMSSRSRIAGYIATKLSNLTNLGSSSTATSGGQHTCSAPASPLNKQRNSATPTHSNQAANQSILATPLRKAKSSRKSSSKCSTTADAGQQQLPFAITKDYGGCDFILYLESSSHHSHSKSASAVVTSASSTSSAAPGKGQEVVCHSATGGQSASSSANGCGSIGQAAGQQANASGAGSLMSSSAAAASSLPTSGCSNLCGPLIIHLVAPNLQEKAAWMSDISQCIDNVHFNDLFHGSVNDSSSVTINQSVRTDPRLYKDDVDIKFSRALNSCKLPQIRYASKERLFERLTDLRFLSIDFLNTFLLTYRVFTTAEDVLESLKSVHYNCDRYFQQQQQQRVAPGESNISLSSLDQQQQPQQNHETFSSSKPTVEAQQQKQEKPKTSDTRQKATPPQVPSRTSQPAAAAADTSQSNFLSANSFLAGGQNQKRRSTISALTPITGSNSSSLANLTGASNKQHQQVQPPLGAEDESHDPDLAMKLSEDDERFSDSSSILGGATNDRARSCSMISNDERSPVAAASSALSVVSTCLAVPAPGGRQVRASSFSHVADFAAKVSSAEHWRLSYKKSTAAAGSTPKISPTTTAVTTRMHLLSPSSVLPPRRASSSDVNVTFQVTLEPPPSVPASSSSSVDQQQRQAQVSPAAAARSEEDQLLVVRTPVVPPSTPSNEPAEVSVDGSKVKLDTKQRRGTTAKFDNATTSSSSSLSSSESTSTKLVSTSLSESGLIQTTDSTSNTCSPVARAAAKDFQAKKTNKRSSRASLRASNHRGCGSQPIIKEIDLTVSQTIDCDTSADEDKVSTSSGGEDHEMVEEEKSFKLLARLNSVQLSDDDDSQSEVSDLSADMRAATDKKRAQKSARQSNGAHRPVKSSTSRTHHQKPSPKKNEQTQTDPPEVESSVRPARDTKTTTMNQQEHTNSSSRTPEVLAAWGSTQTVGGGGGPLSHSVAASTCQQSNSSRMTTPRSSFQHHAGADPASTGGLSKAGVIITSSSPRVSSRRSSTASAASAFAAATAASNNPLLTKPPPSMRPLPQQSNLNQPGGQQLRKSSVSQMPTGSGRPSQANIYHAADGTEAAGGSCPCCLSIQQRASICGGVATASILSSQRRLIDSWSPASKHHHPSCIYANQQQQQVSPSQTPVHGQHPAAPMSDASSLCNSRASSRLSSSAGLDYSSAYSSVAQVNFYAMSHNQQFLAAAQQQQQQKQLQQQLHYNNSSRQRGSLASAAQQQQQQQQPQHQAASRLASNISSSASTGKAAASSSAATATQAKRNSSAAQINIRSVATIRVLSVLRHWVSKHSQDFVNDTKLSHLAQEFLRDLIMDSSLLPAEHKAALQLQQMIQKAAHSRGNQVDLDLLLAPPAKASPDSIESLSALEIAEGMTYLDHKIFLAIRSEEFLGQAWMKMDKAIRAPHILLITKRFNDVSRLVSSEIIRVPELHRRVAIIEKWTNVAHICRVVHNFNGVLQICAAFTNSAVFRLKKTWDKIPKTTKSTIDQLQGLVSTDSRFRNMRDAINRCDPPSIPYVGMYLTDLSFIEEGTPNYSPDGLLNFSKMRMIAHVIREIQHLQNGSYKIELNQRVANYLLDSSRHLQDDEMYRCSLAIEPRSSGSKPIGGGGGGGQSANNNGGSTLSVNQSLPEKHSPSQQPPAPPGTPSKQLKSRAAPN